VLATVPTGSHSNGSHDSTLQPNLGAGKGFGRLDIQTTLGATLPLGNTTSKKAGRSILWNVAAQYKIGKYFWPEVESNATFYEAGVNGGKKQEFLAPGLMVGKIKLHPDNAQSRTGFVSGIGMQIATNHFHTYNHALVVTGRYIF
jgi:hypothetical protein